jgi:uncharacterized protein (TIGR04255 family)
MTDSGDGHVSFRNPPAIETLQGVFFRPLPKYSVAYQGLLWAKYFRHDFPHIEEKSCLEQMDERFGEKSFSVPNVRWRISDRPEAPRIWARSVDGNHVVQIQRDAVLTNWLKQESDDQYRHYASRRDDFVNKLKLVSRFFEEEEIGDLEPTSCLMTYVNHIPLESISDEPALAEELFTFWSNTTTESWLPLPDQLSINISYPMPDTKGRLHVQVVPAVHVRAGKEIPVLRFDLTARGRPTTNTIEDAIDWLDIGHDWIVRAFVDITRNVWHNKDRWERLS